MRPKGFETAHCSRVMALDASLDVDHENDRVRFVLTVTNRSDEPITARFSNSCRIDVTVTADGTEYWRYTDGRAFAQVIGEERFEPGEARRFAVEWTDPDEGTYTATGVLTAQDQPCEATTAFTV